MTHGFLWCTVKLFWPIVIITCAFPRIPWQWLIGRSVHFQWEFALDSHREPYKAVCIFSTSQMPSFRTMCSCCNIRIAELSDKAMIGSKGEQGLTSSSSDVDADARLGVRPLTVGWLMFSRLRRWRALGTQIQRSFATINRAADLTHPQLSVLIVRQPQTAAKVTGARARGLTMHRRPSSQTCVNRTL